MRRNMMFGSIVITMATLWLYWPLTKYYFFQDDFILFHLADSVKSFKDVFSFSDVIFWRPLGAQGYFLLAKAVFGFNARAFHVVSLLVHLFNAFMVWIVVTKLTKDKILGWLTAFVFATSAVHFMSQVWIGEFPIIIGFSFWILGLLSGLWWLTRPSWKRALLTGIVYALGLLSHELAVSMPLVLFGSWFVIQKNYRVAYNALFKIKGQISLMVLPGFFYVVFRTVLFPIPATGEYSLTLGLDALKSIWWYALWFLNVPEELKYQSTFPLFIRGIFRESFLLRSYLWQLQPLLFVGIGIVAPLLLLRKNLRNILFKRFTLGAVLLISGGIILLLALKHQYPFLLLFSLPGCALILSSGIAMLFQSFRRFRWLITGLFLVSWFGTSLVTVGFTTLTHWTIQEAVLAERIISSAQGNYGSFPRGSVIVIPKDKQGQHRASMADDLGIKIIFNDPTLSVQYGSIYERLPQACVGIDSSIFEQCLKQHGIFTIKI